MPIIIIICLPDDVLNPLGDEDEKEEEEEVGGRVADELQKGLPHHLHLHLHLTLYLYKNL